MKTNTKKILPVFLLFTLLSLLNVHCISDDDRPRRQNGVPIIINIEKRPQSVPLDMGDKDTLLLEVIIDANVDANWKVETNNQNINFSTTSGVLEKDTTLVKIPFTATTRGMTNVQFIVTNDDELDKFKNEITFFFTVGRKNELISITGLPEERIEVEQFETFIIEGMINAPDTLSEFFYSVNNDTILKFPIGDTPKFYTSYAIKDTFNVDNMRILNMNPGNDYIITYGARDVHHNDMIRDTVNVTISLRNSPIGSPVTITGLPDTVKIVESETFTITGEVNAPDGLLYVDLLIQGGFAVPLKMFSDMTTRTYSINQEYNSLLPDERRLTESTHTLTYRVSTGSAVYHARLNEGTHTLTYRGIDSNNDFSQEDIILVVSSADNNN